MKRFYVIVFLLIAAAACIGLAIAEDSGYELIAYKSFRYESTLWATLALLLVLWLVIWGYQAAGRAGDSVYWSGQSLVAA